jgi:hypothetical protein
MSEFIGMEDQEPGEASKAFDDKPVKTPSFSTNGTEGDNASGAGADDGGTTGTGGGATPDGGSTGSGGGASQGGGTGN